jgi:uncharacterized membrane protein
MQQTILGIFTEQSEVENTIDKLKSKGFNPKDISIVMKDKKDQEELGHDTGTNIAGGALSGATTGAVVGGIAGLLAGTVLPGLGGFLIGGPIGAAIGLTGAAATTVSGAATGAVAGGLIGALMGLGLKKDEAEHYQERVKEGAILVAVPTSNEDTSYVNSIFDENNAQDVKTITSTDDELQTPSTKRQYADTANERGDQTHHAHHAQYAHEQSHVSGTKGGHVRSSKGRGWHGDSEEHAEAGKGKEPRHSKK